MSSTTDPADASPPAWLRTPPLADAFRFARMAHEGPRSLDDTGIEHPLAVAELLHEAGYAEHVLIAALLHDTVEDSTTEIPELRRRFGDRVADLVDHLSEDPSLRDYGERKAALRDEATSFDDDAAAIFAADKLASMRALARAGERPSARKAEHYRRSVAALAHRHPELPFLSELRARLSELTDRPPPGE